MVRLMAPLFAAVLGLILFILVASIFVVCDGPIRWVTISVDLKHFLDSCKDSLGSISSLGTLVTVVIIGFTALIAWQQVRLTADQVRVTTDVAVVEQKSRLEHDYAEITERLDSHVKDFVFKERLPADAYDREGVRERAAQFHIGLIRMFLVVHECDKKHLLSEENRVHWRNSANSWFKINTFNHHWDRVKRQYPKSFQDFIDSCRRGNCSHQRG